VQERANIDETERLTAEPAVFQKRSDLVTVDGLLPSVPRRTLVGRRLGFPAVGKSKASPYKRTLALTMARKLQCPADPLVVVVGQQDR